MAVFTPVNLEDLSSWISQFPLGKVHRIRGIESGIENSNFFIDTDAGEFVLTIFEKLSFNELPFYLELMRHLAQRGILVPLPIANHSDSIINELHGKPASIVTKLEGKWVVNPEPSALFCRGCHASQDASRSARFSFASAQYAQPGLVAKKMFRLSGLISMRKNRHF